jgi:glycosyltransferase involved in cell wall biosynthesis
MKILYKTLKFIYRLLPIPRSVRVKIRGLVGRGAVRLQRSVGYESPEVLARYAEYEEGIRARDETIRVRDEFIEEHKDYMDALFGMLSVHYDEAICYFDHSCGGGANQYLNNLINTKKDSISYIVRVGTKPGWYKINVVSGMQSYERELPSIEHVEEFLLSRKLTMIVINNLYLYPSVLKTLELIVAIKRKRKIKLVMNIHDYFSICPIFCLLDENNRYCGLTGFKSCDTCNYLETRKPELHGIDSDIFAWRKAWGGFLRECDSIIAFSNDSKNIMETIYGELPQITVIPHTVDYIHPLVKVSKSTKTLNIGFVGHIINCKGLDIMHDMIEIVEGDFSDVRMVLIGSTDLPIKSPVFTQTGRYNLNDLPILTLEHDIDIFFISSVWPETFSYTTQEIIEMNMPIACFDIGAPAERVKGYDKGFIIPEMTAQCAVEAIIRWSERT